jgi:hypothetical protein
VPVPLTTASNRVARRDFDVELALRVHVVQERADRDEVVDRTTPRPSSSCCHAGSPVRSGPVGVGIPRTSGRPGQGRTGLDPRSHAARHPRSDDRRRRDEAAALDAELRRSGG